RSRTVQPMSPLLVVPFDLLLHPCPVSLLVLLSDHRAHIDFTPLSLHDALPILLKRPPIYAGIAMKRRSGPLAGIPSCSGLSGKLICAPCEFADAPAIR